MCVSVSVVGSSVVCVVLVSVTVVVGYPCGNAAVVVSGVSGGVGIRVSWIVVPDVSSDCSGPFCFVFVCVLCSVLGCGVCSRVAGSSLTVSVCVPRSVFVGSDSFVNIGSFLPVSVVVSVGCHFAEYILSFANNVPNFSFLTATFVVSFGQDSHPCPDSSQMEQKLGHIHVEWPRVWHHLQ
jgi:hypothetical protein